jgi:hypothetical protein
MARITATKANQIILYLYAQGFKAGSVGLSSKKNPSELGNDIADYLIATGHNFANSTVEKKVREAQPASWSAVLEKHKENDPMIESLFGINAYELDKYTKNLAPIILSPRGSPYGADGGGKGRSTKSGNYNTTGWDTVNLDSIANNQVLHPDYVTKLINIASGATRFSDEFDKGNPRYQEGSSLATYSGTVPTISAVSAPTITTTTTTTTTEEEEEVITEGIAELADSIITELQQYKIDDNDWSIFVKDGGKVPVVESGDRKVSSKSYTANSGSFPVTKGQVIVTMPVLNPELGGIDIQLSIEGGLVTPAELDTRTTTMTKLIEVLEEKEDETDDDEYYLMVAPPSVQFILDADKGQVFISINGEVIPAVLNESGIPYLFSNLEIIVTDPTISNKIIDVKLDGASLVTGKTVNNPAYGNYSNYGFPLAGVAGLPPDCYKEHYDATETSPGKTDEALAAVALWRYIEDGGRDVRFGTASQSIIYNFEDLDDSYLQPLALNYDSELDLATQAVYFNLKLGDLTNSTLFPGFNINDGKAEAEGILYPNDVSNLRPVDEDGVVMLQKFRGRKAGEGIEQIRFASSNLQGPADVEIGGITYNAEVYTQVEITFEDGKIMTIPDSDERFKGVDNSNTEISGIVQQSELTEKPQIFILSAPTNLKEVYESIEKARRSARISDKSNRKDTDNNIITQTAMIKQDDSYYIIMGVGDNTVVVELDMSREE